MTVKAGVVEDVVDDETILRDKIVELALDCARLRMFRQRMNSENRLEIMNQGDAELLIDHNLRLIVQEAVSVIVMRSLHPLEKQ